MKSKLKTMSNIMIFLLFMSIFAASLITATLPTKTVMTEYSAVSDEPISIITSKFNIQSLIEKPKYVVGLGIIAFLSLGGAIFIRYYQKTIDEAEKSADDEKTT